MIRRTFLQLGPAALSTSWLSAAGGRAPLVEPHFPNRLYQFVWRNWELANTDRMAAVAGCSDREILELGAEMGLPPKPLLTADQLRRIHITVIRQNWHLLPDGQLIELLGWDREKYAYILKEDDFLDVKLGPKPECEPVRYAAPDPAARARAAEIRATLRKWLGPQLHALGEPPFHFIGQLSDRRLPHWRDAHAVAVGDQLDISGWAVQAGPGVDPAAAARLAEYLGTGRGRGNVRLGVEPGEGERFRVEVDSDSVNVTGRSARALLQAVYWLQDQMEESGGPFLLRGRTERTAVFEPRYLYPFFALYGDPLLETESDPFPDGYLEKLARTGINGVWMQSVLNLLAPSRLFPEFGKRSDERLANLHKLTERLERFGMRAFLYLNEPRSMPEAFFAGREHLRGVSERGNNAICTSVPEVRAWIADSLAHVFERAPKLGGVFTITASENLSNCHSHMRPESCPRCSRRPAWDVIGEFLGSVQEGVRRSSKDAAVIAWDWGWTAEVARNLIPKLPSGISFMSVSEWSIPIERGGVKSEVGEYSISVVGPGPRAKANWTLAREAGLRTLAKTQFNASWEMSAVPYVPVPNLVARHCANLREEGVSGIQASWTVGGYPSPNLEVAKEFYYSPAQTPERVLRRVAVRHYGRAAADGVLRAWSIFSEAFEGYPYGCVPGYLVPVQHGPANLLRVKPTGQRASMILCPQDDLQGWLGPYPPAVARDLFARMADRWQTGVVELRKAVELVPPGRRAAAERDLAIAETCSIHFRSTADQIDFCMLRLEPRSAAVRERMRTIAARQRDMAVRMYTLARRHSVLAFEASNHYYYRPLDLAEAIVSAENLLDHALREG